MAPRIPLPTDELTALGNPDASAYAAALGPNRRAYYKAVYSMRRVDPVTRELARMRNARFQHCNL